MKKKPVPNILLDLDGTLADPALGFVNCIRHALDTLGVPSPPDEQITSHIGPPLAETLTQLLGPDASWALADAVRLYRERYVDIGIFENAVYDGVIDALEAVAAAGAKLFVATSKPQVFAAKIVDHFGLSPYFTAVYGSRLDGTHSDKRELLAYLLEQEAITSAQAIMVGDRSHDIRAARYNGMRSLGVLWGYGSEAELIGAQADQIISSPPHLPDAVII